MVLLTMTSSLVEAIDVVGREITSPPELRRANTETETETETETKNDAPLLEDATVGKPISHEQILDIWKRLRSQDDKNRNASLEGLLRGTRVYVPPPPPKPEPVRHRRHFHLVHPIR